MHETAADIAFLNKMIEIRSEEIENWTGTTLQNYLKEQTDGDEWNGDTRFDFFLNGNLLFHLEANGTVHQPRNGRIFFHYGQSSNDPRYDSIKSCLKPGFAKQYGVFQTETFGKVNPDAADEEFEMFVLWQFEIARRVDGDPEGFPMREEIEDAIMDALILDTSDGYKVLLGTFRGEWKERRINCRKLRKMKE